MHHHHPLCHSHQDHQVCHWLSSFLVVCGSLWVKMKASAMEEQWCRPMSCNSELLKIRDWGARGGSGHWSREGCACHSRNRGTWGWVMEDSLWIESELKDFVDWMRFMEGELSWAWTLGLRGVVEGMALGMEDWRATEAGLSWGICEFDFRGRVLGCRGRTVAAFISLFSRKWSKKAGDAWTLWPCWLMTTDERCQWA